MTGAAQASADLRALAAPGIPALVPHLAGRFVDAEAVAATLADFVADPAAPLDDPAAGFVLEDVALDDDVPDTPRQVAFALHLAACLAAGEESESAGLLWPLWAAEFAAAPTGARDVWSDAAREMAAARLMPPEPGD